MLKLLSLAVIAIALTLMRADQINAVHPRLASVIVTTAFLLFAIALVMGVLRMVRTSAQSLALLVICAAAAWYTGIENQPAPLSAVWLAFAALIIVSTGAVLRLATELIPPPAWLRARRNVIPFSQRMGLPAPIDLPDAEEVMGRHAQYLNLAKFLAVFTVATSLAGAAYLFGFHIAVVPGIAIATLVIHATRRPLSDIAPWLEDHAALSSAVLSMAGAAAFLWGQGLDVWMLVAGSVAAGLVGSLLGKLLYCVVCILLLPVFLLIAGIAALERPMAQLLNPWFVRYLRKHHRSWVGEGNKPLINLTHVLQPDWKVFVMRENYRGQAMRERGVPRFSAREITGSSGRMQAFRQSEAVLDPPKPAAKLPLSVAAGSAAAWLAADDDDGYASQANGSTYALSSSDDDWDTHSSSHEPYQHQWVNPGSGLPTIANMPGSMDIAGNAWGENH